MARKQVVSFEDDIDGGEATQTIKFTVDGSEYEIDVNDKNAAKMREAFGFYVDHARKISGPSRRRAAATGVDLAAVRAWAADNGIAINSRGRIPAGVLEQYRAAGN